MNDVYKGKDVLKIHKEFLNEFWKELGYTNDGVLLSRKVPSPRSKDFVIGALIGWGEIILEYNSSHDRNNFEERKWQKQFNGFKLCFACKQPAQVRHHIIWLKNGGRNQKNNIIGLCRDCHAEVHPWLKS